MYIWTKDHQILNLDHYARVTVNQRDGNVYELLAIDAPESTRGLSTVIAHFNSWLDAEYANCLLFKALIDHAGAWDATAITPLSQQWEEVKDFFSDHNEELITDLLTHSEISVTGLEEVTISYSKECDQKLKDSLRYSQREVEGELELGIDIKWVATDDIPWKQ